MYFGHGRGIDRLDPIAESVEHLRLPDDVQGSPVYMVTTDTTGDLWFVANQEGQRLAIRPPENSAPGPVLIDRIQLSGEEVPVSERGATGVSLRDLPEGRNALRIEYVGLGFASAGVRYQYRVDGTSQAWSKPTDERSVNFVNFAPNAYRFAVRGIDRNGRTGPEAFVAFVVPAPFWQRPWFVVTVFGMFMALGFGWHRLRIRHVLAVERIRRQVALDLHDDVGAGLTRIAMLSDLSERENDVKRSGDIGTLARSLRESMSDIVWAIDPRHDHVVDLARRIRQVAFHLEESSSLPIHLNMPDDERLKRIGLAADRRRHLLLILKETLTNAVRHARASAIHVDLVVEANELRLTVRDDGQGFDLDVRHAGHGLDNLRTRAGQMGGRLEVTSHPGSGTSVTVSVRLS
jgi:signal transduction histidine kinase